MEADADEAAAEPNSKHVKVSGQEFDLGALLGMSNLQEMLRTLAGTLVTTQHDNEQLRQELAAVKAAGEQREEKLEAMITAKANGVRVEAIALAFETFREEQRKAREGSDTMAGRIVTEQKEIRSQMDHFDDDILEIRRGLTKKIEAVVFEDLLARSAHFASKNALTECEARLSVVIEQVDDGSKERGRRQEAVSQDHTERLRDLERELPTLQPVQAAARERSALEESIRMAAVAEKERHQVLVARLDEFVSETHAQASEVDRTKSIHWKHIKKLEDEVKTKADDAMVWADFAAVKMQIDVYNKGAEAELAEVRETVSVGLRTTAETLCTYRAELDAVQAELPTKAPLTDLPNLREKMEKKILLLKEDTHDQIHMLREDWSRRMRAVQTRLDTTDRELVRQVEDARPLDSGDRYQELLALIESKADRDASERWIESSQHLNAELQAVHVRTQTLGQGMKVVLGWLEGMAEKVSDVQGVTSNVMSEVNATRTEMVKSREIAAASAQAAAGHIKAIAAAQAEAKLLPTYGAFHGAWAPKIKTRPTTPRGRMFEDIGSNPAIDGSAPSQPQHRTSPRPMSPHSLWLGRGLGMDYGVVDGSGRDESRDGVASTHKPRPPNGPREAAASPRAPEAVPASFDVGPPPGPTAPPAPLAAAAKTKPSVKAATATQAAITTTAATATIVAARYNDAPVPVLSKGLDLVVVKEGSAMGIPSPISSAPKPGKPHAPGAADQPSSEGGEEVSPWDGESPDIAPRVTSTALHSRGGSFRTRPGSARERATSPERLGMDVAQVGLASPGMVTFGQVTAWPRSAAPRTEVERRKMELDAKRRQLIETRMSSQSAVGQQSRRVALTPRMSELQL